MLKMDRAACFANLFNLIGGAHAQLDVVLSAWQEKGKVPDEFRTSLELVTSAASSCQAALAFLAQLDESRN